MFVDEPDWEMTCVGHWDEDWNSYLITWDPEDPTSAFRCWVSTCVQILHVISPGNRCLWVCLCVPTSRTPT